MTDPPTTSWWTQTTVSTIFVTTGAPEVGPFPNNDFTANPLSSLVHTSLSLAPAMGTTASLSTTMSSLVPSQTRSIVPPRGDALTQTLLPVFWGATLPIGISSIGPPLSTATTSGTASSPQPPLSLGAAPSISGSGPDSSPPVYTGTLVDPAFATTPPPHTTSLSTAAKSGIAVSTSLIAIIFLLGVLAVFWRKKRTAETKRGNDLESKAIWVKKTFTVETKARSRSSDSVSGSGSGSPQSNTNSSSVVPAEWTTIPCEDARVAKRCADVDVVGGLTRWSQGRKGVHKLRE